MMHEQSKEDVGEECERKQPNVPRSSATFQQPPQGKVANDTAAVEVIYSQNGKTTAKKDDQTKKGRRQTSQNKGNFNACVAVW